MDDIEDFLNFLRSRFPQNWLKTEEYIILWLTNEGLDPLDIKSKYVKNHICLFKSNGRIEYVLKENAKESEAKKSKSLFEQELIDYQHLFKDYDESYFDVDAWCSERLELEVKEIREFLFKCSFYKGAFFIRSLFDEMVKVEKHIDDLWKYINPNWLQKEITDELKINLKYIKEVVSRDFSFAHPDLRHLFDKGNKQNIKSNIRTQGNWYDIARLMADGTIEITERGQYLFKGNLIKIEMQMSRLVSEHLDGNINPLSIKPYLSKTKSPEKSSTNKDKNIFIEARIKELIFIASEAQKNGFISDYFSKKLEQLKSEKIST